jgi:hypothetical protein
MRGGRAIKKVYYRSIAEANSATAAHIAAHSPSDSSNISISETRLGRRSAIAPVESSGDDMMSRTSRRCVEKADFDAMLASIYSSISGLGLGSPPRISVSIPIGWRASCPPWRQAVIQVGVKIPSLTIV